MDEDLIRARLKLLAEYISDLEGVQESSFAEFMENKVLRRFVERTLQLAIEACLDIGSHIISSYGYREPQYGRHVMDILAENGWIDQDLREHLVGMVGFRYVLVHDYAAVDPAIVFGVLTSRLPEIRSFGKSVLVRMDRQPS